MFEGKNIENELKRLREKSHTAEDRIISETKRILKQDLFTEKRILENLKEYMNISELVEEEEVDVNFIFTLKEIKRLAVINRLKFLDSNLYKLEIPYEAVLKIKDLEKRYQKNIKTFKVLAVPESFNNKSIQGTSALFAKTNYDNYYLIHRWGDNIKLLRKIRYWPLRSFETLALSLLLITLFIVAVLPTRLITHDAHVEYWNGYRVATFFHLLIFNFGVSVYITFAFSKNFTSSIWNRYRDFD